MTRLFVLLLVGGFGFTMGRLAYDEWIAARTRRSN